MTRKRKITASVENAAVNVYSKIKSNPVKVSFGYDEDSIIDAIMNMNRDELEKLYLSVMRKYYKMFASDYKGYTAQHLLRDIEKHIDRHSERDILDTLVYLVSEGAIVPTKKASKGAVSSSRKIRCASDLTDKQAQDLITLSEFAADIIKETERDYGKKMSQDGWAQVMNHTEDLIRDPSQIEKTVGKGIESMKMHLESVIYDIYEDDTGITGIYESTKINRRKVVCNMKKRFSVKASTAAKKRNRVCASTEYPYLYVLKHGYGPGTLPKNVEVGRVEDYKGYTLVWLNRFLTTSELNEYDIPSESQLERYLGDDLERFMPMPKTKRYTDNFISMSAKMRNRVCASKRMRKSIKASADDTISIAYKGNTIYTGDPYDMYGALYRVLFRDSDAKTACVEYLNSLGNSGLVDINDSPSEIASLLVKEINYQIDDGIDVYENIGDFEIFTGEPVTSAKSIKCAESFILRDMDLEGTDDVEALRLFIRNDGDLYRTIADPTIQNLAKKMAKGTYRDDLAVKAWQYLADAGVKKYDKEVVGGFGSLKLIPKSVRTELAEALMRDYTEHVKFEADRIRKARGIESSTSIKCAEDYTTLRDRDITYADDVTELVLYITNDSDLYHHKALPIIENLKRKVKRGSYNDDLAVKAWMYLADDGVRKYDREFGSGRGSLTLLNKPTREAIARELRDHYKEQVFADIEAAEDIYCAQDVSKDDVRELVLFITNEQSLYNQAKSIIDNMKRKIKSGKYDEDKAVDAWMYLADAGTKLYDKRYGSGKGSLTLLNKATRRAVAEELKDYFDEEVFEDVDASTDIYCSDNSDLTVNLDALELGEPYYEHRDDDPDTPDQWVLVIGKNPEEGKNYKLWYYMDSTDADLSELDLNNPDHIDLDEMSTMEDYDEIQLSQDIKCSTVLDKHGKSVDLVTI